MYDSKLTEYVQLRRSGLPEGPITFYAAGFNTSWSPQVEGQVVTHLQKEWDRCQAEQETAEKKRANEKSQIAKYSYVDYQNDQAEKAAKRKKTLDDFVNKLLWNIENGNLKRIEEYLESDSHPYYDEIIVDSNNLRTYSFNEFLIIQVLRAIENKNLKLAETIIKSCHILHKFDLNVFLQAIQCKDGDLIDCLVKSHKYDDKIFIDLAKHGHLDVARLVFAHKLKDSFLHDYHWPDYEREARRERFKYEALNSFCNLANEAAKKNVPNAIGVLFAETHYTRNDEGFVEEIKRLCRQYASAGRVDILRALVEGYQHMRKREGSEYLNWYGRFFGNSMTSKLSACNYLRNNTTDSGEYNINENSEEYKKNKSALNEGLLGYIYRYLKIAVENKSKLENATYLELA